MYSSGVDNYLHLSSLICGLIYLLLAMRAENKNRKNTGTLFGVFAFNFMLVGPFLSMTLYDGIRSGDLWGHYRVTGPKLPHPRSTVDVWQGLATSNLIQCVLIAGAVGFALFLLNRYILDSAKIADSVARAFWIAALVLCHACAYTLFGYNEYWVRHIMPGR